MFYHKLMPDQVDLLLFLIIELRLHDIETGVYLAAMLVLIWVLSDCELCRVATSILRITGSD